jgi:hypothetical protein
MQITKARLWRNVIPIHSLTGPVGQPFASCLGGQGFASWGCTNSQWNQVSPVSVVSLHWWPWPDWSLASPRLCADNGKLHSALCRRCEKPAVITHCLPQFHSIPSESSSSSHHSDLLEPQSSCLGGGGGGRPMEALQCHSNTQSHRFIESTVCSLSRGSAVRVLGMHELTMEPGFSC